MAEKNHQVPHSIQSLLYVDRNGNYCGYKLELISDGISGDLREFLICSECKGICRKAMQGRGNTVCEMCSSGAAGNLDQRVGNKVASLNSKCPLSGKGCSWKGNLGKIEQHMAVCQKVLVECENCDIKFEREQTELHSKEVCPSRMIECEYCGLQVKVREVNRHIGECVNHPDTEVPCPYKELGCDVITLRKNKDTHLIENMIVHQKLMLDQLNRLRNRNQQLEQLNEQQKDKIHEQERVSEAHMNNIKSIQALVKTIEKEQKACVKKENRNKRVFIILALIATILITGITAVIGISVAVSQSNGIQYNSRDIQFIKGSIGYLNEYIPARGKELTGIEWIYHLRETGDLYGPTFYWEQCKLRLRAYVYSNRSFYTVERLNGSYESIIRSCFIAYIYATFGYLDDIKLEYTSTLDFDTSFGVGNSYFFSRVEWQDADREAVIRVYFDT